MNGQHQQHAVERQLQGQPEVHGGFLHPPLLSTEGVHTKQLNCSMFNCTINERTLQQ